MKTINRIIVICLAFSFSFTDAFANHETNVISNNESFVRVGDDEIILHGQLDTNAGPNDIEAYVFENNVYINFYRSFGYVSVTLYSPSGMVLYSNVINTEIQQQVVIPILVSTEGAFTIVLENANGYIDGEFEHNNS